MKGYGHMALAAFFLGLIGIFVKQVSGEMHYMAINFYRAFFGFVFLLAVVPLLGKRLWPVSKKDLKEYAFVGLLFAVSFSLTNTSMVFAPIQNVVFLLALTPFSVMLFASLLLKERITTTKIVTLLLAIAGLAIMNPFKLGGYMLGNGLALGAVFVNGFLITQMRKEDQTHDISDVVWFMLFASLFLLPSVFVFGFGTEIGMAGFKNVIMLGVLCTGAAYLFYNLSLKRIEAEMGSIIELIVTPLVAVALAVVIVDEALLPTTVLGGSFLLLAGLFLQLHRVTLPARLKRLSSLSVKTD